MPLGIESKDLGHLQWSLLKIISMEGEKTGSDVVQNYKHGNGVTKEITNVRVTLTNPRSRIINHPKTDLARMLGRLCWELRGSKSAKEIKVYDENAFLFAKDGIIPAAYGSRINFQLNRIIDLLKDDSGSRRAYVGVLDPMAKDDYWTPREFPCLIGLHFFIR